LKISIIIPVLNEIKNIALALDRLSIYRNAGHEIIVVDGGSDDGTLAAATGLADQCFTAEMGRAFQMNAGAAVATGDVLLFLHADTQLPVDVWRVIQNVINQGKQWGFFKVRLSGSHWMFRIIETMMNLRSCLSSVATGDQVLFVSKELFVKTGAYPVLPLMEDVAMSKLLRKRARPECVNQYVVTSSRRWQNNGILRTVLLMWWLRLQYFLGAPPEKLVKQYYR